MSEKPLILVVDDESINLEIMQELLEQDYLLEFAKTGEECLGKLEGVRPELILLDINMPGITGLEVCEQIKQDPEVYDIPILFVSALTLPEERMRGYKVGGDDYISKPFNKDELLVKVELTLACYQKKSLLKQSSNDAMGMAMTAMTQASEMGEVMQFTRDSYLCDSYDTLASRLLESLNYFDLNATFRLTGDMKDYFFSSLGVVSDREEEVMEHAREKGRFIHFGKRTIINFQNISILIKNMPVDEEDKYGQLNDVLGMLIESADARVTGIEIASSLITLINGSKNVLADIEKTHKENEKKNELIMEELEDQVEWAFINMHLNEEQEEFFRALLEDAKQKSNALYDANMEMDEKLHQLISSLSLGK